jgi:hypothetical protein
LFHQDISEAGYVYLFGLPRVLNSRIKAKLEEELPEGATVISYGFQIEGWKPFLTDKPSSRQLPIFLYHRP